MTAKLVVLYPKPKNQKQFEKDYSEKHLPLMRRLIGPNAKLPTYRVNGPANASIYRIAEIHFPDSDSLYAFLRSDHAREGQASALSVSTGGAPTFLFCLSD